MELGHGNDEGGSQEVVAGGADDNQGSLEERTPITSEKGATFIGEIEGLQETQEVPETWTNW